MCNSLLYVTCASHDDLSEVVTLMYIITKLSEVENILTNINKILKEIFLKENKLLKLIDEEYGINIMSMILYNIYKPRKVV